MRYASVMQGILEFDRDSGHRDPCYLYVPFCLAVTDESIKTKCPLGKIPKTSDLPSIFLSCCVDTTSFPKGVIVKESKISCGLVSPAQRASKKNCTLAQFWPEKSGIRPMPKMGD